MRSRSETRVTLMTKASTVQTAADFAESEADLPRLERLTQVRKQPQDTIEGCRVRAAADRERAAAMDTHFGTVKLERSAAAWTERGDMLERLEASFEARRTHA
ncbi:MAG: hypothetical protein JWO25_2452 [Alphaproteobacteria bacterium]|nr:hypothetical protein [Alphaproteobacteria bacterium]MDB5722823.1 hypothetical protein [Alphaproteobacteria bacterium]